MLRRSAFDYLTFALADSILVLLFASGSRTDAPTLHRSSQVQWPDRWQTKCGMFVLRQNGARVRGDDLHASGVIGARVQTDGRLHGTVLRSDRRRGVLELRLVPAQVGTAMAWNATTRSGPAQMPRSATRNRKLRRPDTPPCEARFHARAGRGPTFFLNPSKD